jgi:PAS domain S-box-containing protein
MKDYKQIEQELPIYLKNASNLAVVVTDLFGNYIYVNPTFEKFYQLSKEDILGCQFGESVHTEDIPRVIKAAEEIINNPTTIVSITFRKPNHFGDYIYTDWQFSPFCIEDELKGILSIGYNLTEKVETEKKLESQKILLDIVGSLATEGVASFSFDNKLLFASEKFLQLHGYDDITEMKLGIKEIYINVHPEDVDRVKTTLSKAIQQKESLVQYEYRFLNRDNSYHWHFDTIKLLYDENGTYSGCHVLSKDISKRKEVENTIIVNEQKLQHIISALPDPILVLEKKWHD